MSLFNSSIRPSAVLSDEAIERYVASIRAEIDPDPHFRRRLRGIVVNRFVATREGLAPAAPIRAMGRLGRACLYASFVLGLSVTSVMAASESAIPGDLLYPLKRQIEVMRLEVLPAAYHPTLLAHDLSERISELDALVERGDWARAEALAPVVADDIERLVAAGASLAPLDPQLSVLEDLVARLPEQARGAITHAIEVSSASGSSAGGTPATSGGGGAPAAGGSGGGGSSAAGGDRPSAGQPGDVDEGSTGQGSGAGQGGGTGQPENPGSSGHGAPAGIGPDGGPPDRAQPSRSPKAEPSPAP